MKKRSTLVPVIAAGLLPSFAAAPAWAADPALEILKRYADDYAADWTLNAPTTFGVKVGDTFYTVEAAPKTETARARVEVREGAPTTPTFYYPIDSVDYLSRLDRGEVNALTLMAKAFSTDVTPMDIEFMEGYQPPDDIVGFVVPLTFHFWTRGKPEFVNFAEQETRFTHGTNAGIFYYQPGLRSGWFNIEPGHHVNADERSQSNPFPSMFFMLKGEATARLNGVDHPFREGNMMFVPAGVRHEFLNEGDAPAFGFLFMFGEGA